MNQITITEPTDTYKATIRAVLEFILTKAPVGIKPREIDEMRAALESSDPPDRTIYVTFRREGTQVEAGCRADLEASMSVGLEPVEIPNSRIEAANGDLYRAFTVIVRASWPAWGLTDPLLALQRIGLMQEVAIFANLLAVSFSGTVYQLDATKAERDERAASKQRVLQEQIVRAMIEEGCKGLRVGSNRAVAAPAQRAVAGLYKIEIGNKSYKALVFGDGSADVRRAA